MKSIDKSLIDACRSVLTYGQTNEDTLLEEGVLGEARHNKASLARGLAALDAKVKGKTLSPGRQKAVERAHQVKPVTHVSTGKYNAAVRRTLTAKKSGDVEAYNTASAHLRGMASPSQKSHTQHGNEQLAYVPANKENEHTTPAQRKERETALGHKNIEAGKNLTQKLGVTAHGMAKDKDTSKWFGLSDRKKNIMKWIQKTVKPNNKQQAAKQKRPRKTPEVVSSAPAAPAPKPKKPKRPENFKMMDAARSGATEIYKAATEKPSGPKRLTAPRRNKQGFIVSKDAEGRTRNRDDAMLKYRPVPNLGSQESRRERGVPLHVGTPGKGTRFVPKSQRSIPRNRSLTVINKTPANQPHVAPKVATEPTTGEHPLNAPEKHLVVNAPKHQSQATPRKMTMSHPLSPVNHLMALRQANKQKSTGKGVGKRRAPEPANETTDIISSYATELKRRLGI